MDVSEPRAPRKEIDIIEEELANRRRAWIREHMVYLYAAAGVVIVALIVLSISIYERSTNPISRFINASAKDFGTPFSFTVTLSEDNKPQMTYTGSIDVDRTDHEIRAVYDATYDAYFYRGAVFANDKYSVTGSLYGGKWEARDCSPQVLDFFDFDTDWRKGTFDGAAFLRFTDIASDYSTRETNRLMNLLKQRLSTNSDVATFTAEKTDGDTRYDYDISLITLFDLIEKDGASLFYRASEYDAYAAKFELNRDIIEKSRCTMHFIINVDGYLTEFGFEVTAGGVDYALSCTMSEFGTAQVEIPDAFLKTAGVQTE